MGDLDLRRALASGDPSSGDFAITAPIGPVPHPLLGTVQAAATQGKPASTHVTVLEKRPDGFLCDVRIATGDPGYYLHAAEIVLRHPRTDRELTIECAPPPVLRLSLRNRCDRGSP